MVTGDLVRFKEHTPPVWNGTWQIGLLIDYKPWEKIARILCNDGTIKALAAVDVQKFAGRGYRKNNRRER